MFKASSENTLSVQQQAILYVPLEFDCLLFKAVPPLYVLHE